MGGQYRRRKEKEILPENTMKKVMRSPSGVSQEVKGRQGRDEEEQRSLARTKGQYQSTPLLFQLGREVTPRVVRYTCWEKHKSVITLNFAEEEQEEEEEGEGEEEEPAQEQHCSLEYSYSDSDSGVSSMCESLPLHRGMTSGLDTSSLAPALLSLLHRPLQREHWSRALGLNIPLPEEAVREEEEGRPRRSVEVLGVLGRQAEVLDSAAAGVRVQLEQVRLEVQSNCPGGEGWEGGGGGAGAGGGRLQAGERGSRGGRGSR